MVNEEWRPIPGYEGLYEVSDHGNVRSLTRTILCGGKYMRTLQGQPRKPVELGRPGERRKAVSLCKQNKYKMRFVHQLVLEAFVGPRPLGMHACHNDGDRNNNIASNLRWDTPSANIRDQVLHGTHHEANKTHCPQRHAYDAANTIIDRRGKRRCRRCHTDRESARGRRDRRAKRVA